MADTAVQSTHSKSMTIGEGGTALALAALAFVSLIVAAKAYTPEYALHAYLFTAASAAAVIAIVNRYYERPGRASAADDRRAAQLQHGSGQVRDHRSGDLGHCRLHGRAVGGARACISGVQSRSALDIVRPPPPAAHVGGDFRVRRQRADRDLVLRGAAHLPGPARRRHRALVRGARLQLLHRHRRHRLSARASRNPRNMPSPSGMPICGSRSSGSSICWSISAR